MRTEQEIMTQYERVQDCWRKESPVPATTKSRILALQVAAAQYAWVLNVEVPDWAKAEITL